MKYNPKESRITVAYGRTRTISLQVLRWRKERKAKGCLKDSVHPKRKVKIKNIFE